MAASIWLAKNVMFNLYKPKGFPNTSLPSLKHSNISSLSFSTSASKHPSWDAKGDSRADHAYEDAKEGTNRAAETVEEATERVKEGVKGMKEKTEEMAKEGTKKAKEMVHGAWEAAKDTTSKIKEKVMGRNNEEEGEGGRRRKVMDEDVRRKTGTKFDE